MEDQQPIVPENQPPTGCIQCNHPIVLEGYPNRLCRECREKFIRFPIPLWVKGFGAGVLLLTIISFSINFKTYKLHRIMNKATAFVDEKKYSSAAKNFQKVLAMDSTNIEAHGMNMLCSYFNGENETCLSELRWLIIKDVKDDEVSAEVLKIPQLFMETYPDDTFGTALMQIDSLKQNKLIEIEKFVTTHTNSMVARYYLANEYFDADRIAQCDSVMDDILDESPTNIGFLTLKVATLRRMEKYAEANKICDQLLQDNKESYIAYIMKTKIATSSNKLDEAHSFIKKVEEYNSKCDDDITFLAAKLHLLKKENNMKEYNTLLASTESKFKDSKPELDYLKSAISKFN